MPAVRRECCLMMTVVLVVVLFGTDVTMKPMETMEQCLENARRVATVADWGNVDKTPRRWSVECKRMKIWLNS
ncbi:MAG: hypothetical protein ACR2Q4_06650 [Geminicoccaceae bacterium]